MSKTPLAGPGLPGEGCETVPPLGGEATTSPVWDWERAGDELGTSALASADEESSSVPASARGLVRGLFWAAALALACVATLAAAGLFGGPSAPQSLYQRTMAIAGEYRCPVCPDDESVASSDDPAAVEIRQLIRHWLEQGTSQAQIRARLVADYGPSVLEKPPASGLDALVWALPALAAVAGATGLGLGFHRWRRRAKQLAVAEGAPTVSEAASTCAPHPGRGPLLDLNSEPPTVTDLYNSTVDPPAGAGAAEGRTGAGQPAFLRPSGRFLAALWRRVALPAGVALVLLAAGLLLLDHFSSPELPDGTITGTLSGLSTELLEARVLTPKDPVGALTVYQHILKRYPDQPIALAAEGWIYAEAGLGPQALAQLTKAERADPSYGLSHFYRGLVLLYELKQPKAAAGELQWYLSHAPAPDLVKTARQALSQAKDAVDGPRAK